MLFPGRDPVTEPGTSTGTPGNWWTVFALVLEGGRVQDAVFDALQQHLSDEEILELTYITALYDMHAVMSRALKLEYDDIEERIAEIPAPAEYEQDVMGVVDTARDV
jgi:hypothetical protein